MVTAVLLLTPNIAFADGGEDGYVATANGYQIELVFKEPAKIGENEFHVQIMDAMGMPAPEVEVEVTAMPAESMSAHEEGASVESSGADSISGMDMATETPSNEMDMSGHDEPATDGHDGQPIMIMLEPALEAGEYTGEISLDESGLWTFNAHFTINGEMTEVEFPVDVIKTSQNYGILAGFFSVNASMIAAAAFLNKRKSLSA